MISLAAFRIAGTVIATTVAFGVLFYLADLIRDSGRNEVWAKVDKTIETFNDGQGDANAKDAEERMLRQKLRSSRLLTATTVIKTEQTCKLTAEEATAIGAIQ